MTLLSDEEIAAIRALGEEGMNEPFIISRANVITLSSPSYDAAYDYGDDMLDDPDPVYQTEDVTTVDGWLVTRLVSEPTIGQAQLAVVDTHILRFPWGTDLRPNDIARRVATGEEYVVGDTNGDDTWAEWLKANVRRRE